MLTFNEIKDLEKKLDKLFVQQNKVNEKIFRLELKHYKITNAIGSIQKELRKYYPCTW